MSVLFLLVPLALSLACGAVFAFIWAARRGEFDDLKTPAIRILTEEDGSRAPDPPAREDAPHKARD